MARYIDAEELCRRINECWETNDIDKGRVIQQVIDRVITPIVVGTPTADVVEVVRCEKCTHKVDYCGRIMCAKNARRINDGIVGLTATSPEHFCSYGERKDADGKD